jgi:hypothetical protein
MRSSIEGNVKRLAIVSPPTNLPASESQAALVQLSLPKESPNLAHILHRWCIVEAETLCDSLESW